MTGKTPDGSDGRSYAQTRIYLVPDRQPGRSRYMSWGVYDTTPIYGGSRVKLSTYVDTPGEPRISMGSSGFPRSYPPVEGRFSTCVRNQQRRCRRAAGPDDPGGGKVGRALQRAAGSRHRQAEGSRHRWGRNRGGNSIAPPMGPQYRATGGRQYRATGGRQYRATGRATVSRHRRDAHRLPAAAGVRCASRGGQVSGWSLARCSSVEPVESSGLGRC
jgi:hypothetical protein